MVSMSMLVMMIVMMMVIISVVVRTMRSAMYKIRETVTAAADLPTIDEPIEIALFYALFRAQIVVADPVVVAAQTAKTCTVSR